MISIEVKMKMASAKASWVSTITENKTDRIQARLKHMCFKLLRSTSCALIHLGNLFQDRHCVIPHL